MADLGWVSTHMRVFLRFGCVFVCKKAGPGREERGQCDLLGSFSSDSGPHTHILKGGTLRKKTKPIHTLLLAKRPDQN